MDWYLKVLKNYIGFGGRARRKEYWMFILVNLILTGVLSIIDKMLGWQRAGGEGILTTVLLRFPRLFIVARKIAA